jgi:hypothetical protein
MAFKERLKFYADTYLEKNKLYCFTIFSVLDLKAALWRFFDKGWYIRAAWYEKIDLETGVVQENQKLQLTKLLEEYLDTRLRRK